MLCDKRTCHGCSEEILTLVNCVSLESRVDEVCNELVFDVLNVALCGTALECLSLEVVVVDTYADLTAVSDNFAVVMLKEPRNDD